MGSSRHGDEAAVLVVNEKVAVVTCVRYSDANPDKNPYLHWAIRQAYKYNTSVQWYSAEQRVGRHTARVLAFAHNPEAQAAVHSEAMVLAGSGNSWARSFQAFKPVYVDELV